MKKILLLLIIAVIIAGGAWFLFVNKDGNNVGDLSEGFGTFDKPERLTPKRTEQSEATLVNFKAGNRVTYNHQRLGFSFEFPQGFKVGEFSEGFDGGETILIQEGSVGFQLHITSFDENIVLTKERIRQDISDMVIDEPLQIKIGNAIALVFLSDSESLGRTREIWWVYEE